MARPDHITRTQLEQPADTVGLILIDTSLNPVYVNSTARHVISYALGKDQLSEADLREAIRTKAMEFTDGGVRSEATLISGRRKYACRTLTLERGQCAGKQAYYALIFERISRRHESLRRMVEQYGLTPREREIAFLLTEGLTSKEMAQRLNISPHTVKGYLNFLMRKLGVTTRSGIVGMLGSSNGDDSFG
jgi:DNA-binding CsgD family transcriptional regulator